VTFTIYHSWIHPLRYSPLPPIPEIVAAGLIFPFSYMSTEYFHNWKALWCGSQLQPQKKTDQRFITGARSLDCPVGWPRNPLQCHMKGFWIEYVLCINEHYVLFWIFVIFRCYICILLICSSANNVYFNQRLLGHEGLLHPNLTEISQNISG
jgi:hypothetical protein